jgi:hypothetical protein
MDKKLIFICLLAIMHAVAGCTYIPSTHAVHMAKSGNYIYVATTNSKGASADYVRVFDTIGNSWKTVTFKNTDNPNVNSMLSDNDGVIVQLAGNWKTKGVIYKIKNEDVVTRIVELSNFESLAGMDENYFYVIERKDLNSGADKRVEHVFTGAKYDKQNNVRTDYHFEASPNLIVRDVWEDSNDYWYACFQEGKPRNYVIPSGTPVLVKKSKQNGKIDIFQLGDSTWERDAKIIGDNDWIWIYHNKQFSGNNNIIKFSKKDNSHRFVKIGYSEYTPFKSDKLYEADNFVWLLASSSSHHEVKVIKVDKFETNYSPITFPDEIHTTSINCADKDFLWIDAYKVKGFAPSGNTTPYLLKVAKSDSSYELIFVKPTIGTASATVLQNFFSWIIAPFMH